jgi:hypothetical protein
MDPLPETDLSPILAVPGLYISEYASLSYKTLLSSLSLLFTSKDLT